MKIKRDKNNNIDKDFDNPQYMTNGNLYDVYNQLKKQKNIDLSTLPSFDKINNEIQGKLASLNTDFFKKYTLEDYWLLQLHCNYFTNTLTYKCNNHEFNFMMQQVIRFAWLNGKAGIYFDVKVRKWYGIIINSIKMNLYGEITEITYWPIAFNIDCTYDEIKEKSTLKITGKDCKNVAIFRWGTSAISAWIMYWPFVKFQNLLLKMLAGQSLAYNRKYIYNVLNPKASSKEMELWYDPLNMFIVNTIGNGMGNKFSVNEGSGEGMLDFVEFYKQCVGVYYSLFGRRANLDFKRERNTVEEVSLTSGSIENLERDWFNQFNIFVKNILDINKRLNIIDDLEINDLELNNWIREKILQGEFIENENETIENGEKK